MKFGALLALLLLLVAGQPAQSELLYVENPLTSKAADRSRRELLYTYHAQNRAREMAKLQWELVRIVQADRSLAVMTIKNGDEKVEINLGQIVEYDSYLKFFPGKMLKYVPTDRAQTTGRFNEPFTWMRLAKEGEPVEPAPQKPKPGTSFWTIETVDDEGFVIWFCQEKPVLKDGVVSVKTLGGKTIQYALKDYRIILTELKIE